MVRDKQMPFVLPTKRPDLVIMVVGEEEIPDLFPLHIGSHTACPFPGQQLRHRGAVDAGFWVMIGNVAHLLPGQPLVISEVLLARKVSVAAIADKGRGIVPLVLLDNVLPSFGSGLEARALWMGEQGLTSIQQTWESTSWHTNGVL